MLWQPLNLEGDYKQLTAQLNPLQEFKQSPPESLSWCGMSKLCRDTALGSEQQPSHCECRSAGACEGPSPPIWPALSWPEGEHSAFGFCTHRLRGVTDQNPAGRKLKLLDLFYFPIISAVGASLPGINSLVFGGHDCQWMNQEPLA